MQWWIWCRQYRRRKLQNDNGGSLCRGKRRMIKKGGKKSWCNRLSRNGGERSTAEESTAWALTTSRRKVKSGYEREKPYNSRIEDPGRKLDCGPWNIKRKIGPNLKLITNCIMGHPIGNPFHFLQLINSWWLEQASRWIKKECSYGLLSLKAQMRRYVINQEHYWTLPKKVEGSSSFWARTIRGEIEAQLKYHESEESYRCFHEREFSSFLHRFCLISVPRFVRYFHCFLHLSSPYTSNRVLSCVVVADLFKTQNLKTFLLDFGWVGEGVTAVTTQFFHHRIFESKRGTTERKQLIHHRVHINEAAAQIGSVDCCILVFSHSDEVLFVCFSVRNDAWLLLKLGDLPKFKEFWSIYAGFCSFPHHQEWQLLLSRLPYFYDSVAIFPYLYVYETLIVEFIWEDRLPVKVCWTNFPYPSDDSISMFMNGKTIKWVQESELEVSTMVAPEGLQWGGPRVWQWIGAQMVLEIDFGGSKFYFREEPSTCHWGFTDIPGHKDFVVFLEESGTGGSTGDIQTHRVWTGRFLSKFEITKIEGQSDFFIHFAGYRETFCSFAWSTAIFIWLILISVFEWHCIGRGWSCSSVVL